MTKLVRALRRQRRDMLTGYCAILFISTGLMTSVSIAQEYPTRPVRIVTSAAGGTTDLIARYIARGLTASLGQQVIVDNRPTGIIPAEIAIKASPDGHTLLFHGSSLWMMPLLQKVPFDPATDLAPVTLATTTPNLVVVHPSVAAESIKQLIALAKTKPGALNYGSGATGAASHLAGELFKHMADIDIQRVPYKGQGPAVLALLAGEVQVAFASTGSVSGHIRSGKLRALAITSTTRSVLAPGLPTVAEAGLPGFHSATTAGLFAPLNTPARLIALLNREIVSSLEKSELKNILLKEGSEIVGSTPQEFAAAMKSETASMSKVIKAARITAK